MMVTLLTARNTLNDLNVPNNIVAMNETVFQNIPCPRAKHLAVRRVFFLSLAQGNPGTTLGL